MSVDPDVATTNQPYAFTNDNPLNAEDPLGLSWWNPFSWSTKTWENIAAGAAFVALAPIPGVDVIAGAIAVGAGSVAAGRNIASGNYTAAALDTVGVGLSAFGIGAALQSAHDAEAAATAAKDSGYLSPILKSMAADKAATAATLAKSAAATSVLTFGVSSLTPVKKTTCSKGSKKCN
jgi:hypothetical protein